MLLSVLGLCLKTTSAEAATRYNNMAQLKPQEIASLLQQQGIAKEKIPTMTAIALAESGGRAQAFNPRGLDKSYGLFQVNMYGGLGPARMKQFGLKEEKELFDPATNVRAAKDILGSQGLGAWSVYKSGKYKEFLPQAQAAVQQLGQQTEQKPEQIATAPKGNTYIIYGEDPGLDFLRRYTGKFKTPEIQGLTNLASLFNAAPKEIDTGFDPVKLLAKQLVQPSGDFN
jgi:hypothetical protein